MKTLNIFTLILLGIFFIIQPAKAAEPAETDGARPSESSNDNYEGDCFHLYVKTDIKDSNNPGKTIAMEDGWYLATKQNGENLKLVKVKSKGFICSLKKAEKNEDGYPIEVQVNVHDLDGRAKRTGWVYGGLILPFKYHFDDKSFSGETTVGPYIGRRSTLGDTTWIWALTAGLTPLSVDSTDQTGNPKSTQLSAFTYAAGLMFEINKGASPFRAGVFFGQDVVSKDSAVTYTHDRKNWVALQLGWDFAE